MTISLPGSKKRGLAGLLGRKKTEQPVTPTAQKQLDASQVAKLFSKKNQDEKPVRSSKLNEIEKHHRDEISNLRGALYSKK
jgi:hypothetical protein